MSVDELVEFIQKTKASEIIQKLSAISEETEKPEGETVAQT